MSSTEQGLKPRESQYPLKQIASHLEPFLKESSPFNEEPYAEGWYEDVLESLNEFEVLVVGAGGLGCEIVKNLALSGIRKIHLVDMDTIDLTNLNRQFLFRQKDVGKKKAEVVAEFVMRRCPGVQIFPHTSRVQQLDYRFYCKFSVIIGGLDNVEARKFLNTMVHQINEDQEETVCFYIDGATEGFEGQCIVVEPFKTSCYNCSLPEQINQPKVNYCTIANTPRTPEHCIQYVLELEWDKHYPNTKRDNDNLDHMTWIYQKSLERAKQFKIEGLTEMLTMGVAKNIIPAIASTNAIVAAFSTNEAMKIITATNPKLKNYFFYRGGTSTGSDSYALEKKIGCKACEMRANNLKSIALTVSETTTFDQIIQMIRAENQLVSTTPYVNILDKTFYNPFDRERRDAKLAKTVKELYNENVFTSDPQEIVITDNSLKSEQIVSITVDKTMEPSS